MISRPDVMQLFFFSLSEKKQKNPGNPETVGKVWEEEEVQ